MDKEEKLKGYVYKFDGISVNKIITCGLKQQLANCVALCCRIPIPYFPFNSYAKKTNSEGMSK